MQARYATMVLVFVGCANVIMSKVNGVTDIIMTTLLLQRMVELGGVFIGVLHRVTSFEREGLGVQKCFKILTIDQENKTQPRHTDKTWPQKGAIKANNVLLRYTKNSDLVLKGLNVNIKGGEKVGIVGRTGAGKSTLANAVTRIVEICGGTIEFDGVDIGKINLDQVRESITIIPQEPTLFKGTIKFNMDPTGKCTD
jgi:ABC-type bacteriocin/lantibiotic exporter with double-glycine peptidase domain